MERTEKIMNRMNEHYNHLIENGYEVVGLFLQGSQNYELDYELSDIDTKAIVLPSLEDIVLERVPVSTTLVLENDEHIDVKDIRTMFKTFKKQNINFVEALFTKFHILNEKYAHLFEPMMENAERVARYNNYAAINCMAGMAMEKKKAMEHPYPATLSKIEKFGYDPKQLHHIMRMTEFMRRYVNGEPYADCLVSKNKDYLLEVKKGCLDLENARIAADLGVSVTGEIKRTYMTENPVKIDVECDKMMEKVLTDIITLRLKSEFDKV